MAFAIDIITFSRTLPRSSESEIIGRQLMKAGTSVGANYRAACCGRSDREWLAKLSVSREEADECVYWLTILTTLDLGNPEQRRHLMKESAELTRLLSQSVQTFRSGKRRGARA